MISVSLSSGGTFPSVCEYFLTEKNPDTCMKWETMKIARAYASANFTLLFRKIRLLTHCQIAFSWRGPSA